MDGVRDLSAVRRESVVNSRWLAVYQELKNKASLDGRSEGFIAEQVKRVLLIPPVCLKPCD